MKICTKCKVKKPFEEFHRCTRDGYQARCKECLSRRKPDPLADAGLRECTGCHEVKSLEADFYERRKGSGLRRSQCKTCYNRRAYETRDPEKARAAQQRRQQTEKFKARNAARSLAIYYSDPEYYRMKQRARNLGAPRGILKEIMERDKVCQLCGSDERLEFDHIHPRSEGGLGTKENLQLLCKTCNVFKSNNFFLPDGGVMINGNS